MCVCGPQCCQAQARTNTMCNIWEVMLVTNARVRNDVHKQQRARGRFWICCAYLPPKLPYNNARTAIAHARACARLTVNKRTALDGRRQRRGSHKLRIHQIKFNGTHKMVWPLRVWYGGMVHLCARCAYMRASHVIRLLYNIYFRWSLTRIIHNRRPH